MCFSVISKEKTNNHDYFRCDSTVTNCFTSEILHVSILESKWNKSSLKVIQNL